MITVTINIDPETRQEYSFNTFDFKIVFVKFTIQTKPKGKRIWRIIGQWDKYDNRVNFKVDEPELTPFIRGAAKTKAHKQIKVMTWKEFKGE